MSLLDAPPHVVTVYPEVLGTDGDGNRVRVPGATPVEVRGLVQPLTASESTAGGQVFSTSYTFLCREFPAGPYARVEWDGRTWDVQGEPGRHTESRMAASTRVVLRARDPQALP